MGGCHPAPIPPREQLWPWDKTELEQNQKIVEVTVKSGAGGSSHVPSGGDAGGGRGKESLAVPGVCGTGCNVLGKGCGSGGTGKQEGCCVFSHFLPFLNDAGLWGMLAVEHVPPKAKAWGEDRH